MYLFLDQLVEIMIPVYNVEGLIGSDAYLMKKGVKDTQGQ